MQYGTLIVEVTVAQQALPIEGAATTKAWGRMARRIAWARVMPIE